MQGPQGNWLADGKRLHLNHGPIDLIVEAFGEADERRAAYDQAVARFQTILIELVEELPELRLPAFFLAPRSFAGPTARRSVLRSICSPDLSTCTAGSFCTVVGRHTRTLALPITAPG